MREGPDHYTRLKPEPIDVIRAWELPWCTANALKYIARYRNKGGIEDLKKARHYLDMEIEALGGDEVLAPLVITSPAQIQAQIDAALAETRKSRECGATDTVPDDINEMSLDPEEVRRALELIPTNWGLSELMPPWGTVTVAAREWLRQRDCGIKVPCSWCQKETDTSHSLCFDCRVVSLDGSQPVGVEAARELEKLLTCEVDCGSTDPCCGCLDNLHGIIRDRLERPEPAPPQGGE